MEKIKKIRDLEQVRLLSDPLKLKLLQAFAEEAQTTKAVARRLGEPVTKLYRHVDALLAAGLLDVVGERRKRGAIERTFRAVAARFEVDQSLFAQGNDAAPGDAAAAVRDMLRVSEQEIVNALTVGEMDGGRDAILMRLRLKASPARIDKLRRLLSDWLDQAEAADLAGEPAPDAEEHGALIAFYPLHRD